jgi:LysR family glycine cleavage system transcriptional activator
MDSLLRYQLNALRAVEAAGRLGSLAKAAEELGVTVGAVSQHVRNTERQLGSPLFGRSPKGLSPTPAAARLLAGLTSGFGEIDRALATLERRSERGLVATVAPVFAAKWLVPRLPRFHAIRPRLQIRIDASVAFANLDSLDADVGIRVGSGGWPGVRAVRLLDQTIFPVCNPSVARRLSAIADLARVPIIRDHGSKTLWSTWLEAHAAGQVVLGPGPTFSDSALCLDAAIGGQGVMMTWPTLAQDALDDGRLVAPFATRVPTGAAYWLVTSAKTAPSADVRAFGAWIQKELTTTCTSGHKGEACSADSGG